MATDLLNRNTNVRSRRVTGEARPKLSGDALISFISGCQSNIGRQTYYNLAEEQKKAMDEQHIAIFENSRFFYTLMSLPNGVNDVNKQHIVFKLFENTLREEGLKDHQHDPVTRWENEIIIQVLSKIPVTRVFNFFVGLKEKKMFNKRISKVIKRYLLENKSSLGLWTIKYQRQLRVIFKHLHVSKNDYFYKFDRYICEGTLNGHLPQIIKDYDEVRKGNKDKLHKLPYTVAEGFQKKFNLTKAKFDKLFVSKGGQLTKKEKQTKTNALERSNVSSGVKMENMKLFDLFVYLKSRKRYNKREVQKLIREKGQEVAKGLSFKLKDVGLILDTSQSMYGSKTEKFHPLLKGLAIGAVLREASDGYKEYRTNGDNNIIPELSNTSNYADSVMKALKDGCKTIIIIGDGYENAPYEGATHNLLYTYKKKIDVDNQLIVLHLNPVFASECFDAREITSLAPQMGVRGVEGINENIFLALAKQKPELAIAGYVKNLVDLQSREAKRLMPTELKKFVQSETKKLK